MKKGQAGFALVGSLIVASLATALLAVVQRVVPPKRAGAAQPTLTSVLAEQKLEKLRGLFWGFDELGSPVIDHDLAPSPEGTLQHNTPGYVDYLDAQGVVLGTGEAPPSGTKYIRRWSIEPLKTNPENSLLIRVVVSSNPASGEAQFPARLTTVKTRKALVVPLSS